MMSSNQGEAGSTCRPSSGEGGGFSQEATSSPRRACGDFPLPTSKHPGGRKSERRLRRLHAHDDVSPEHFHAVRGDGELEHGDHVFRLVEQNILTTLEMVGRAIVLRSGEVVFDGNSGDLARKEDLWSHF